MGDADAAAIRAARGDWVSEHLEIYLTSGGTRGHIMDLRCGRGPCADHALLDQVCGSQVSEGPCQTVDLRHRRWRDQ